MRLKDSQSFKDNGVVQRRFGLQSGVSWLSLELRTLSERFQLDSLETDETETAGLAGAGARSRRG